MTYTLFGSDTSHVKPEDAHFSEEQVREVCHHLLGDPETVTRLGGLSRHVWRVSFADASTSILVFRHDIRRAELERNVLFYLRKAGAPVPSLHVSEGHWIATEDLGDIRLPLVSSKRSSEGQKAVEAALQALLKVQSAGHQIGLSNKIAPIGRNPRWVYNLCDAPDRLAARLKVSAPTIDKDAIATHLNQNDRRFIKWDARPGNAMLFGAGAFWIDFEHCGARDPLDDLAWFIGDETLPNQYASDAFTFDTLVPAFKGNRSLDDAKQYLRVMGCLHMCIRLDLILRRKKDGLWWNEDTCLKNDNVLVTARGFTDLAKRASNWAAQDSLLTPLADWLLALPEKTKVKKVANIGPATIQFI